MTVVLAQHQQLNRALEQIVELPEAPRPDFPPAVKESARSLRRMAAGQVRYPSRLLGSQCHLVTTSGEYFGLAGAIELYDAAFRQLAGRLADRQHPDERSLQESINLVAYNYGRFLLAERVMRETIIEHVPELGPRIAATRRFLVEETELAAACVLALEDEKIYAAFEEQEALLQERHAYRLLGRSNAEAILDGAEAANMLVTFPQLKARMAQGGLVARIVEKEPVFFPQRSLDAVQRFHDRTAEVAEEASTYVNGNEYYEGDYAIPFRGESRASGHGWVAGLLRLNEYLAAEQHGPLADIPMKRRADYALVCLFHEVSHGLEPLLDLGGALLAYEKSVALLDANPSLERAWQFQFAHRPELGSWFGEMALFFSLQTRLLCKEHGTIGWAESVSIPGVASSGQTYH